jgi:hypothetical protein
MALLPSIPTSFVPHVPGASPTSRPQSDASHLFAFLCYGALLVVFVMAVGVFAYGQILKSQQTTKDAALAKAEAAIDPATVEGFVRLRNRLTYGSQELQAHVAFSSFFNALQTLLPSTVRFSSLHLSMDPTGTMLVDGAGIAKSFNALASLSNAFAQDGRIKNAIFSKISVKGDNSVSFGLTATLDPKLIAFSATSQAPSTASSSVQMVNPTPQQ